MNVDLLELGQKLESVIKDDISGLNLLTSYMEKRATLEEEFASNLQKLLNSDLNSNSLSTCLIIDEIHAVFRQHSDIAEKLRKNFLPPIINFKEFIVRQQKKFTDSLNDINDSIKTINRKLSIAKSQLDRANLDALNHSSTKNDRSRRTRIELESDVKAIKKEQEDTIKSIHDVRYPKLMKFVDELDFSMRTTIKNCMINFVTNEISASEQALEALNSVYVAADRYEPASETQKIGKALGFGNKQKQLFAIALCDFEGSDEHDLPLYRGQLVEVFRQHPTGWWEGEAGGRRGNFPMTFVEPVVDMSSGTFVIEENFEVEVKFDAQEKGQLSIDRGDVVFVYSFTDGWCDGYNIATGERGLFPTKSIKYIRNFRV